MNLKQILRSLLRDWLNTLVIIVSLAVGFACINLIILFINRELGTDNFHFYKDQIYALSCDDPWFPGSKMFSCKAGSAEYMKNNFAGVEDFCRFNNSNPLKIIVNNEDYSDSPQIIGASENFFTFFSYELLTNNPETALEATNNIVISSALAKTYFVTEDPLGKIITLVNRNKEEQMTVTGIFEKPVRNTQINFDMVRLIGKGDSRCYVRIDKDANPGDLQKLFSDNRESIPVVNTGTPGQYYLEPFQKAYFNILRGSIIENNRDIKDLWIALIIGLMVFGIALFNYLGIVTNRFYGKAKEYYIRRINGSSLSKLIARFMLENSLIAGTTFVISFFLITDALPFFNNLTDSKITKTFLFQPGQILILTAVLLLILLVTLFLAVLLIRSNLSLNLLKTDQNKVVRSIQIPAFNVFQLTSSIVLLICSLIVMRQMNFISEKPLGMNKDVIEIKIPVQYKEKTGVLKDELLRSSSVKNVSVTSASPVLEHFIVALKYQEGGTEKQYFPAGFTGDDNFLDVLDIELITGDDFSHNLSANVNKCLINQSFAKLFPDQDLIGKGIPGMEDMVVNGIVKDFNYSDLKTLIEPAFISFSSNGGHLLVKASEGQVGEAKDVIALIWKKIIPDYPVNIESVGDRYEWFHRKNAGFKRLILSCAMISVFLSMIGLFAVSYQKSRSHIKEIGIRKINGANVFEILAMINSGFLRWIVIAFLIATPVAWFAMYKWLESYAYKAKMKWWIFALSGIIILTITLLTVSWQSWRAARRNPVEALRHE
jgi:putative ABC transport system permease protein